MNIDTGSWFAPLCSGQAFKAISGRVLVSFGTRLLLRLLHSKSTTLIRTSPERSEVHFSFNDFLSQRTVPNSSSLVCLRSNPSFDLWDRSEDPAAFLKLSHDYRHLPYSSFLMVLGSPQSLPTDLLSFSDRGSEPHSPVDLEESLLRWHISSHLMLLHMRPTSSGRLVGIPNLLS